MTLQKTEPKTAEQIFAANGFDKNGFPLDAPIDIDTTVYDLDRFVNAVKQSTLSPDADEREPSIDAIADGDVAEIAKRETARAVTFRTEGQHERADEAMRHAVELRALAKKSTVRRALKTDAITGSDVFSNAVLRGDFYAARNQLIAAIKSDDGDHALKAACARALIEVASLVGDDMGEDFNGAWLAQLADIPLRTAQDLIGSATALESGLATLLIGTEHAGRKAFRKVAGMTPKQRGDAIAALRNCYTLHMIESAGKREKAKRTRNISLSELDVLDAIGMNNHEGRKALTEQCVQAGKRWLAAAIDRLEAAERKYGEDASPREAVNPNGKRVLRALTMQRLANERVYSL